MVAEFDPYYKWLGIPPRDQPPHHYRLLGIELFEPDMEVIEAAADRLMAYLQEVSLDENAAAAQKLLNEISAARVCLLTASRREKYDSALRESIAVRRPPPAEPPQKTRRQPGRRRRSLRAVWLVLAAGTLPALVWWYGIRPRSTASRGEPDRSVQEGTSDSPDAPPGVAEGAQIEFDWPMGQRAGSSLWINGAEVDLPPRSPFVQPVAMGAVEVRMTRTGYEPVVWSCLMGRRTVERFSPVWIALAPTVPKHASSGTEDGARGLPSNAHQNEPKPKNEPVAKGGDRRGGKRIGPTAGGKRHKRPAPVDPLKNLPAAIDLPDDSSGPGGWTSLFRVSGSGPIVLQLLGGNEVARSMGVLSLQPDRSKTDHWRIEFLSSDRRENEAAMIRRADGAMQFSWRPTSAVSGASRLRNCLLRIRSGKYAATVRLRTPLTFEPLRVLGSKSACEKTVVIPSLPEPKLIEFQVTQLTGVSFLNGPPREVFGRIGKPVEFPCGDLKQGCPLRSGVDVKLRKHSSEALRLEFWIAYLSLSGKVIRLTNSAIAADYGQVMKMRSAGLASQPGKKAPERGEPRHEYYSQLRGALQPDGRPLEIHYRIFALVAGQRVELARSAPGKGNRRSER